MLVNERMQGILFIKSILSAVCLELREEKKEHFSLSSKTTRLDTMMCVWSRCSPFGLLCQEEEQNYYSHL